MPRPRHEQPTPGELELLKILWERSGPASVRDVFEVVNREAELPRAYTSVMSLLNVMTEKGLLRRHPHGRAFLYEPVKPREHTLRSLLGETLKRVYQRLGEPAGRAPARPVSSLGRRAATRFG